MKNYKTIRYLLILLLVPFFGCTNGVVEQIESKINLEIQDTVKEKGVSELQFDGVAREFRITYSKIASNYLSFTYKNQTKKRKITPHNYTLNTSGTNTIRSFSTVTVDDLGHRDKVLVRVSPSLVQGEFKQYLRVHGVEKGDKVSFRLLDGSYPNITIKVEIFDSNWKTIINEGITGSNKFVTLNW